MCEKLVSSIFGAVFGIFMFFGALVGIFLNEGHAVHQRKAIDEAYVNCIDVGCNVDPTTVEGQVFYSSCSVTNLENKTVLDNKFENFLKLEQKVEMYQWVGNKHCTDHHHFKQCTTTFEGVWDSSHLKDADQFHRNNKPWLYQNDTYYAQNAKLGRFTLTNVNIAAIHITPDRESVQSPFDSILNSCDHGEYLYTGSCYNYDAEFFDVGDERISFFSSKLRETDRTVSVIGKAANGQISSYYAKNGNVVAATFRTGNVSKEDMFQGLRDDLKALTWALRFILVFVVWLGLFLVTGPLSAFASCIPCIGDFIGEMIGCVLGLITFLVACSLSLLMTSVAWISYRPKIGIPLLCVSVALIGVAIGIKIKYSKKKNSEYAPLTDEDQAQPIYTEQPLTRPEYPQSSYSISGKQRQQYPEQQQQQHYPQQQQQQQSYPKPPFPQNSENYPYNYPPQQQQQQYPNAEQYQNYPPPPPSHHQQQQQQPYNYPPPQYNYPPPQ